MKLIPFILFFVYLMTGLFYTGCNSDSDNGVEPEVELFTYSGWNRFAEDWSAIPYHLSSDRTFSESIPERVDLTHYFPPVGRQFNYETSVAWAVGFYYRTYLNALDKQYTPLQVTNPVNQFSPKDLMMAIEPALKNNGCGSTTFKAALDVMKNRGIAQLSVVPYEELGNCLDTLSPSANSSAAQYKIKNYWKIYDEFNPSPNDLIMFKQYLSQNIPIAVGVKTGKYFSEYDTSSTVLYSDTYSYETFNNYHAMVVVGYDDTIGTNGAFKLINSYGITWGHDGYIWVDYDYFFQGFCMGGIVIQNARSDWSDPDEDDDNLVDSGKEVFDSMDLMATFLNESNFPDSTDPHFRLLNYNAYNLGTLYISRGIKWNISFGLLTPGIKDNFTLLFYDYYTSEFGNYGSRAKFNMGPALGYNLYSNINIPAQSGIAGLFNSPDNVFSVVYEMPAEISGEYYFVMIVDGNNDVPEPDEMNNFLFLTDSAGGPISISNGVVLDDVSNSPRQNIDGFSEEERIQLQKLIGNSLRRE